jgi:hypothetical protein
MNPVLTFPVLFIVGEGEKFKEKQWTLKILHFLTASIAGWHE